jgi:hypothetical protein
MGVKLNDEAFFWDTQFKGDANFLNSKFSKSADFSGSNFAGVANFEGSQFGTNKDCITKFAKVIFGGNVSFAEVQMSPISDFRYTHFGGFTNLTRTRFDRLEMDWKEIGDKLLCDESTYIALIKNFGNLGQYEDADNCYFQYREWRQRLKPLGASKALDYFSWITCGYGVRMQQTVIFGLFWLIFFWILYFLISWHNDTKRIGIWKQLWETFWFSVIVLLSAPKELYPMNERQFEYYAKNIRFIPIFERFMGWVLLVLLINNLSRVMIRY